MEIEKRYTTEEAAEKLKLAQQTIYKYIQSGKIKAVKIGRNKFIPESEIEKLLKFGTDGSNN